MKEKPPICFSAVSRHDLALQLENCHISVPRKLSERTDLQREWYTLRLGLMREIEKIPEGSIAIRKTESPDFILLFETESIGIEITELRGRNSGWAQAISEENGIENPFIGGQSLSMKPTSRAELTEEMEDGGSGLSGNLPEQHAVGCLTARLQDKEQKVFSKDWEVCDRQWLFVYNNFGFPGIDWDYVIAQTHLSETKSVFDTIVLVFERSETGNMTIKGNSYSRKLD